jgi:hypothetical protein
LGIIKLQQLENHLHASGKTEVSRPSVRMLKEATSIPFNMGIKGGDKVADAFGIDPGFGVARTGLQTLGGYAASRALPGLAVSAIGLGPTVVGLGALYGGKKLYECRCRRKSKN